MINRRELIKSFGSAIALAILPALVIKPTVEGTWHSGVVRYKGYAPMDDPIINAPYIPSFTITRTKVVAKSRKLKYVGR